MLRRFTIPLMVFAIGFFAGSSTGFFLYSYYFPQKVVTVRSVKLKRSPGASQTVDILEGVTQDTVKVPKKTLFRRIFRGRK